nr:EOG090X0D82 [Scapholeberis mucronata]
MFGLIVSGRLVQTNFEQISETQFVITIPDADNINHLVVFLTGTTPFPEGFGGSVYFRWPEVDLAVAPVWQLLGFLTNNKPSNIYKITGLKKNIGNLMPSPFGLNQGGIHHHAQIGISIEPLEVISSQSPNAITEPTNTSTFQEFAERTVQNLFNYVASFAVTQAQMTPNPTENYIPMSALKNWYNGFLRKLELNPQFWRS